MYDKAIEKYKEYLEKMKGVAIANRNIDGNRHQEYYKGLQRGFEYAIGKLDWLISEMALSDIEDT